MKIKDIKIYIIVELRVRFNYPIESIWEQALARCHVQQAEYAHSLMLLA